MTAEIIADDEATGTSGTFDFTDDAEADWTDFNYASGATTDDNYTPTRRRKQRVDYRKDADWFQVKVSHSTKYQPFQLSLIDLGVFGLGRR